MSLGLESGRVRTVIMGAAGRDFHNFNTLHRGNERSNVVVFTATQIPGIGGRTYPGSLAGSLYPEGIPIHHEAELEGLIRGKAIQRVEFAYSDVTQRRVMELGSMVQSWGAEFVLPNLRATMIESNLPVISVCAVRTGCGKSQTTRRVVEELKKLDLRPVVIRHPMPYGDLEKQAVQRFETMEDLDRHECTIEEREEYAPHIAAGTVVYAGVDYRKILEQAEKEADVILWDGGNNDIPFYTSRKHLQIVVVDPLRPGHELLYYPGETNFRMGHVIVMNKMNSATPEGINILERNIADVNPFATVIRANSEISVDDPSVIRDKRVLVIEDGPTVTHGDMTTGAGIIAAQSFGAFNIFDPFQIAVGSMRETLDKHRHLEGTGILPAMGYGKEQLADLQATIQAAVNLGHIDSVVIGTPIDLASLIKIDVPHTRVRYDLKEINLSLETVIREFWSTAVWEK